MHYVTENPSQGGIKIKIFDSHCHLNDPQFKRDLESVIERARNCGVEQILIPGYDLPSSYKAVELAEKYGFFCSIGLHPHDAKRFTNTTIKEFERLLTGCNRIVAVGEIGLDFYKNYSPQEVQIKVFQEFLEFAAKFSRPVILHIRDAYKETFKIVEDFEKYLPAVILHCFSGGPDEIIHAVSKPNYYISFSGTVTYKNSRLHKALELTPLDRILVETDAPYLTPSEYKGRNEPAYINQVVKKIAEVKNKTPEEVAEITFSNTRKAFQIR